MIYILLIILAIFIWWFYSNKISIKLRTFVKRGFRPSRTNFGLYCFCGKQGSGKTYSIIEYLHHNKDKTIFCNIKGIQGIEYIYFEDFDWILKNVDKFNNCIIVYDEIFTLLEKNKSLKKEFMGFISQMRKREIIFLTSAQEWLEINMTLRRYCRFFIGCKILPLFGSGILIKGFHDAENMTYDKDLSDYVAPLISTSISKVNKYIADSYDTRQVIETSK